MVNIKVSNLKESSFYRSIFEIVEKAREDGLVLYGAGLWGSVTERIFKLFGISPVVFCDDDITKQGKYFSEGKISDNGIPVMSLDTAADLYPNAIYITTVTGGGGALAPQAVMNTRLRERELLTKYSGFHPVRYVFLLEGVLDDIEKPIKPSDNRFEVENLNNMVVFNHMSNSGSVLFGSLMDGNKNIINIPMFGTYVKLKDLYEKRLMYLDELELVIETAAQMFPYLTSQFDYKVYGLHFSRFSTRYFVNKNNEPENRVFTDACSFVKDLYSQLKNKGKVSFAVLIKTIFAAYANANNQKYTAGEDHWIFLMRHKENYDLSEMDGLLQPQDFKRLEYWFIVREPVQQCFSWIKRLIMDNAPEDRWWIGLPNEYLGRFSCELGLTFEKSASSQGKTVRIVRFEDVKKHMEQTMRAVCLVLGISFDEIMQSTTVNGLSVYFPGTGQLPGTNISRPAMSTNDTTGLDRSDFSTLMTSFDILRLNIAFLRFKITFGYDCDVPDSDCFSEAFLRELFSYPFKFESTISMATKEALERGYLDPSELVDCHERIAELFINTLLREDKPEIFSDIIKPLEKNEYV